MRVKPIANSDKILLEVTSSDEPLWMAAARTPFRIKKILVPIDFSECSKKALKYAVPLAKQHDAAITLLYVIPNVPYANGEYGAIDYASVEDELSVTGKNQLARFAAAELQNGVRAETLVRIGSAAIEIISAAKSLAADLIVVSTHGRTGLKHVLLGSVAEHIVRHAPCPVLVVREQEHDFLEA